MHTQAMNFIFNQSIFEKAKLPSKAELKKLFPLAPTVRFAPACCVLVS